MAGVRVIERRIGRPASWWGADRELGADRPRWRSAAPGEAIFALPDFPRYPSQGLQVTDGAAWSGLLRPNQTGSALINYHSNLVRLNIRSDPD